MSELIKIEGIENINTSESTFGKTSIVENKLVIPFYNVSVISGAGGLLGKEGGKYIKQCHLVFEGVFSLVWDYESSRSIGPKNRECYGGVYFYDNVYAEFWIKYARGFIYLDQEYKSSSAPWDDPGEKDADFFARIQFD